MYKKLVILLFLALYQLNMITAQVLWVNNKDSVLLYFIEYKTTLTDSDPVPSSTNFGDNEFAFPWLYLDQNQLNNLPTYLDEQLKVECLKALIEKGLRAYNFSDCNERGLYGIAQGFWWAGQLNRPEWAWDQERRTSTGIGRGGLFHDVESFWYRQPHQESIQPVMPRFRHFTGINRTTLAWR